MTIFTNYFAKSRASKYAAVILGVWAGFAFIGTANAQSTGMVQVTCTTGTYYVGWDNSNQFFNGKGNIAALYCQLVHNTGYVSDNLTDASLRYYQGVIPQDIPTATIETQTQVSQETSTSSSSNQETSTQVSVPESSTVNPSVESPTVVSDSQTAPSDTQTSHTGTSETQTLTSESSTPTSQTETATSPIEIPLPTPVPAVEPQPVPVPVVQVPQPDPVPQPAVVDVPIVIEQVAPSEEQPSEEQPVAAEQQPVEEPSEPPVAEETHETPVEEPESQVQPVPTPEPSPQRVVAPEQVTQPDVALDTPMVTLDNGVIIAQDVAEALQVLDNPAELLADLFTDPGKVLLALGNVGADMSPEARQKSKDAVVQAVIVGSIVSQAAGAAYRRKP